MAHGFLTPQAVSGESPLFKKLYKAMENLLERKIFPLSRNQKVIETRVTEIQNLLKGGNQKALPPAATKMLGGSKPKGLLPGAGAIVARKAGIVNTQAKTDIVGKNATDIDRKEQRYLGTTDPDVAGGPRTRKGGTFTDFGSTAQAKPLNNTNFFSKAVNEGVDANTGEYLSKEARIAAFQKGKVARNPDQGAPPISPDSGADIVAAVNRNTEALVRLVDVTKEQTSNDTNIAQQQIQAQETLMSRSKARAEENQLEKGDDLSSFLRATKLKRKDDGGGSGGGGGDDGLFDFLGLGMDAMDMFGGGKRRRRRPRRPSGGSRRPPRMQVPKPRGGSSMIPRARPPAPKGGFKLPGLPKGMGPKGGALSLLFAGMEFGDRKAEGQSNLQAGVGTAASVAGGLAGAKGGAAAGAAIGALFGGVGAVPGALIGGLIGGIGGSMLAGGAADMATGASKPFAAGGIITKPTQGLVGEAGKEGVFPLEGSRGKKTFQMFGEGIMEAQKRAKDEFSKLQAAGLKFYFQNQDGFKFFGNILKTVFAPFLGPLKALGGLKDLGGGLLNSLFGGPANAAQRGGMVDPTISGDEEEYLMRLMIAEAGGEGELGMAAVGRSVLNRAGLIQSGEVGAGTFMADSGSIMDVINATNQYQPVREGKLNRDLTPEERVRARKALEMARNQAALRRNLGASGMDSASINNIMASTGFRTHSARYDASQEVNVTELGGHRFNTAGNAKMLTPSANVGAGISGKEGTGMATFGETDGGSGRLVNAAGYVHGHFQTNTGTKQDVINDTTAVVRSMLNSGLTDISISDGTTFLPSMSDGEIKGLVERGVAQHTHSGDGRSVDIFVPRGTPVPFPLTDVRNAGNAGRTGMLPGTGHTWVGHLTPDSQAGANQRASANIAAEPDSGGGGGTQVASSPGSPLTAAQKAKMFQNAGMSALSANTLTSATPGPVPASPVSPNTGTPIMATSAQVASASAAPAAAPTVINNYYGGGNNGGQMTPNAVAAGISMDSSGTAAFQELKLRSLG